MINNYDTNKSSIIFLCGKPASGKTTLSIKLVARYKNITTLSCDEHMLKTYGEILDKDEFDTKLNYTKDMLYKKAMDLLDGGSNVILDFGFWTRAERESVKHKFKAYNTIFIYLNPNDETLLEYVTKRNSNLQPHEYYMDEETHKTLSSRFEEFGLDEPHLKYSSDNTLFNTLDNIFKKQK